MRHSSGQVLPRRDAHLAREVLDEHGQQVWRLTLCNLVLLVVIIVSGAVVRLTNSGLGCADWPNCSATKFVSVGDAARRDRADQPPLLRRDRHPDRAHRFRRVPAAPAAATSSAGVDPARAVPRRSGGRRHLGAGQAGVGQRDGPLPARDRARGRRAAHAQAACANPTAGACHRVGRARCAGARRLRVDDRVLVLGTLVTAAGPHGGDVTPSGSSMARSPTSRVCTRLAVDVLVIARRSCSSLVLVRTRAPRRVLTTVSVALVGDGRAGHARLRAVRRGGPRAARRASTCSARCWCSIRPMAAVRDRVLVGHGAGAIAATASRLAVYRTASWPVRGRRHVQPEPTTGTVPRNARAARLAACRCTSSTAPTSCSGSTSRRAPATATPTASRSARRARSSDRCSACSRTARPTSASRPTTSSSRSATTSGTTTRRARASTRAARRSSRCSRTRSTRSASRCGRWSSSRPTTRSRARPRGRGRRPRVEQVIICTPDKDLGQCVGGKVVQLDRRKRDPARRRRRAREVRRAARVDPRLARARRRQRRRLPRPPRVRREVGGRGARALRPPRGDPRRRPRRGTCRACAASTGWRRRSPAGREVADLLQGARDAAHRRRRRRPSTTGTGPGPTDDFARVVRALRLAETRSTARAGARRKTRRIVVTDAVLRRDRSATGITQITLNRPERLNAMNYDARSPGCYDALDDAAPTIRRCRVIVLTGAGRGFCAGLDLTEGATPPDGARPRAARRPGMTRAEVHRRPRPEDAVRCRNRSSRRSTARRRAAGSRSRSASDIRIAAASARFNVAFVRVGLSGCDIGVSWMLPRLDRRVARVRAAADRPAHRRGRGRPHRARHPGRRPTARSSTPRSRRRS